MNYKDFYELLYKYKLITSIWKYELELIEEELKDNKYKNEYLIIFSIYFSLVCAGNVTMSLDEKTLSKKWEKEVIYASALAKEKDPTNTECENIYNESIKLFSHLKEIENLDVIKKNRMFEVKDNYLYIRKYNQARIGVIESIKKLFDIEFRRSSIDITKWYNVGFKLSDKQKLCADKGIENNLIITGGPGTGKTTSILFILLSLLIAKKEETGTLDYNIYLAAASGKASSRMKESIIGGIDRNLNEDFKRDYSDVIDKIKGTFKDDSGQVVEEFTIHRLLGVDFETGGFKHGVNDQFPENSIFVIDEASMIDICMFDNLLKAIPKGARVFILGDKNQLPSVEVGAVFGDLVGHMDKDESWFKDKIIEIDESKRFSKDTDIFKLSEKVNNGSDLALSTDDFKDYSAFDIKVDNSEKKEFQKTCPVYYYLNETGGNQKEIITTMIKKWAKHFYNNESLNVQKECSDIELESIFDPTPEQIKNDKKVLNKVLGYCEEAKTLCAENEGIRGVNTINNLIKKIAIDRNFGPSLSNQYPGQVMMINKNNKNLDLYNGDTGILVSIKDDNTLYFLVKKATKKVSADGYKKDEIFKIDDCVFIPFRLISLSEISLAYAITVHKSQGSDYNNIFIILPTAKGHPLLNRQILYTAITRTKGFTYILSNIESLNEAKDRVLKRDTNIIL